MAHRKWKATKQKPSMLPGPAVPSCTLLSFHFLWAILCPQAVVLVTLSDNHIVVNRGKLSTKEVRKNNIYQVTMEGWTLELGRIETRPCQLSALDDGGAAIESGVGRSDWICVNGLVIHDIPHIPFTSLSSRHFTRLQGVAVKSQLQPADIGWPTGNGKKLSCTQACCLAQLCLAAP